ncbi:MAG: hypothetical protein Alpg2KO_03170 [Alphaproteobacteria bacterium]
MLKYDVVYLGDDDLECLTAEIPLLRDLNFLSPTYHSSKEIADILKDAGTDCVIRHFCTKVERLIGPHVDLDTTYIEFTWARPQKHEMIES